MIEEFQKNKFELKYSDIAPDVVKSLRVLKRTGWVKRGVENPESVYEHIVACRDLVISEISFLDEFSAKEKEEILDMLEIHDWAESDSRVGDQAILKTNPNREALRKKKFLLEFKAMIKICGKLGDKGKRILELWQKFENKKDAASLFARQVDKLQAMEKAFEYEQKGETVSTQEFIDQDEKEIIHSVLVNRLKILKKKLENPN